MITTAGRDVAMSGGGSTRGFWTKRKRTSTSLIAVIGLIAGIAVAFKLFDQEVPNNIVRDASTFDYTLQAQDLASGETLFRPVTGTGDQVIFRQSKASSACLGQQPPAATTEPCNVDTYPGDERRSDVLISNTNTVPAKDASFQVHVDQPTIEVYSYNTTTDSYTLVLPSDPAWTTFVNFWTLRIDKQSYSNPPGSTEYENDPDQDASYLPTNCTGSSIQTITALNPCKLGTIRKDGSMGNFYPPIVGGTLGEFPSRPTDDREYRFIMAEEDDGSDQTPFLGWRIDFQLVFQARISPEPETGRFTTLPV